MVSYRLLYAWTPFAAWLGWLLPVRLHPGKRASASLRKLGIDVGMNGPRFERRMLLSLWRSTLLLRYGFDAKVPAVHDFLRTQVGDRGARHLDELLSGPAGLIIATPHYGAFIPVLLKLIQACHGRKPLSVIFNDPKVTPSNAQYEELFARLGCDGTILYPDRRGTISALKALKRGECVAILPDVYFDSATVVSIPFFRRLLRVMPGTAFFASRTNARIVTVYGVPRSKMGFDLVFGDAIDPAPYADEDDRQCQFGIMFALVAALERQFRNAPEHWNYWESLPSRSNLLPSEGYGSEQDLHRMLEMRLRGSSTLLRRVPGLAGAFDALREISGGQPTGRHQRPVMVTEGAASPVAESQ